MGQGRDKNRGEEEGERQGGQHPPVSAGPGGLAILSCLRGSQWLPTKTKQQLCWTKTGSSAGTTLQMGECGQHSEVPWDTQGQHGLRGPPSAGAPDGQLGHASLVRAEGGLGVEEEMASAQAFSSTPNVFRMDNLISRCCGTEGEVMAGTVTKALGFQDGLIKGTKGEKPCWHCLTNQATGRASAEVTAGFTWLRGCREGLLLLRHAQSA